MIQHAREGCMYAKKAVGRLLVNLTRKALQKGIHRETKCPLGTPCTVFLPPSQAQHNMAIHTRSGAEHLDR